MKKHERRAERKGETILNAGINRISKLPLDDDLNYLSTVHISDTNSDYTSAYKSSYYCVSA